MNTRGTGPPGKERDRPAKGGQQAGGREEKGERERGESRERERAMGLHL